MFKSRKRTGATILLILLVSGASYIIGVNSQGGNPTWDEVLGIFNLPWLNTTQGVNAPEFYRNDDNYTAWVESVSGESDHGALTGLTDDDHGLYLLQDGSETSGIDANWVNLGGTNRTTWPIGGGDIHDQDLNTTDAVSFVNITTDGVDVDWVDLGGVNRTTWPTSGSGGGLEEYPFTYLVFKNATATYLVSGSVGSIVGSHTNSRTVIQWAISNITDGGYLHIKSSRYTIPDEPLMIDGTVSPSLTIKGDGWERGSSATGTVLVGTWGNNILNITNAPGLRISDIAFDQDNANGIPIYAYPTGGTDYVLEGVDFDNIYIRGANAGFASLHIESAMFWHSGSLWIDSWGDGIHIVEGENRNTGNGQFEFTYIRLYGEDGFGVKMVNVSTPGGSPDKVPNLVSFGWLQVYGNLNSEADENNTGVYLYGTWHTEFQMLTCEAITNDIWLTGEPGAISKSNKFGFGYLTAKGTAIKSDQYTQYNLFENLWGWTSYGAFNPVLIDDSGTSNEFDNVKTAPSGHGYYGENVFSPTTILNGRIGDGLAENSGVARNLANGGVAAHGLSAIPEVVWVTSLNATYGGYGVTVAWDEQNTDATNISFDIFWAYNGTAIGDSVIDVAWQAEYNDT